MKRIILLLALLITGGNLQAMEKPSKRITKSHRKKAVEPILCPLCRDNLTDVKELCKECGKPHCEYCLQQSRGLDKRCTFCGAHPTEFDKWCARIMGTWICGVVCFAALKYATS